MGCFFAAYAPPLTPKRDESGYYDLWSVKELVIEGRKRKEIFFAGLIIQGGYVGFYFMPVYAEMELKAVFAPELLRLLKGKSCFHVKRLTPELLGRLRRRCGSAMRCINSAAGCRIVIAQHNPWQEGTTSDDR